MFCCLPLRMYLKQQQPSKRAAHQNGKNAALSALEQPKYLLLKYVAIKQNGPLERAVFVS